MNLINKSFIIDEIFFYFSFMFSYFSSRFGDFLVALSNSVVVLRLVELNR